MAARRAAAAVAAVALLLALQCADLAQAASARRSMRVSSTGALPATKFSRSLQQVSGVVDWFGGSLIRALWAAARTSQRVVTEHNVGWPWTAGVVKCSA